eukprot:TRINITY_DN43378_c0_g1_i1.p1 TRINITY_DN43378_c0_g1~~TRINITY_DN43378_c0_g1_i1.p1  ORF type:complete len:227 (-),score=27.75 TRINITY_DN43378_c0_g1_i1:153-833(-)
MVKLAPAKPTTPRATLVAVDHTWSCEPNFKYATVDSAVDAQRRQFPDISGNPTPSRALDTYTELIKKDKTIRGAHQTRLANTMFRKHSRVPGSDLLPGYSSVKAAYEQMSCEITNAGQAVFTPRAQETQSPKGRRKATRDPGSRNASNEEPSLAAAGQRYVGGPNTGTPRAEHPSTDTLEASPVLSGPLCGLPSYSYTANSHMRRWAVSPAATFFARNADAAVRTT